MSAPWFLIHQSFLHYFENIILIAKVNVLRPNCWNSWSKWKRPSRITCASMVRLCPDALLPALTRLSIYFVLRLGSMVTKVCSVSVHLHFSGGNGMKPDSLVKKSHYACTNFQGFLAAPANTRFLNSPHRTQPDRKHHRQVRELNTVEPWGWAESSVQLYMCFPSSRTFTADDTGQGYKDH